MKVTEAIVSFMTDCRLRGLSGKTLESYSHHLKNLSTLSKGFPPKPEVIQGFLATLNPYNADAHFRTFRALDNYAARRFRTRNFMKSVTRPRIPKQIMPTLSETELSLLGWRLENAPLRDKGILCLFIDSAIRKGEAANLRREDIKESIIIVHGKTGYRQVPISPFVRDLLLSLPKHEDGYVFHGEGHTRYATHRLCSTGLYKIVKKYIRMTGYKGKQPSPQMLRRSFGRFWFKQGGDVRSLQLIYGHSSPNTTLVHYAAFQSEDVAQIHQKYTPIKVVENATVG